ncbi:MAG: EscU/YscU/HrcU family type III secretion system export apparatus switch protein [Hyphomicrobium sp.]
MSEAPDKDSRTEEATEKKLQDAVADGNVPQSREVSTLAFLVAALIAFNWATRSGHENLTANLIAFFSNITDIHLNGAGDALALFTTVATITASAVVPFVLIFMFAGVGSAVLQNKPSFVLKRIVPDFSRVSPASGLKRLTGIRGLLEFVKTTVRFILLVIVVASSIYGKWPTFQNAASVDPRELLSTSIAAALSIVTILGVMSFCFLVFDLPAAHILWRRSLRMAPNEIKDERKQVEGNPQFKARRLGIARARSRRKLIRDVSKATLIVANPTHFAVALRYEREEGGAPRIVAKGQDLIALTIRRLAEEKGIPVVENKALARSLYKKVAVDQMIPIEFYRVIAEILIRLQSRKNSATR